MREPHHPALCRSRLSLQQSTSQVMDRAGEVLVMWQQGWEESAWVDGPPGAAFITALNHKGAKGMGKPEIQTQLSLDIVSTQQSIAVTRLQWWAPSVCRCLLGLAGLGGCKGETSAVLLQAEHVLQSNAWSAGQKGAAPRTRQLVLHTQPLHMLWLCC